MKGMRAAGALSVVVVLVLGVAAIGGAFGPPRRALKANPIIAAPTVDESPAVLIGGRQAEREKNRETTTTRPRPQPTSTTAAPPATTNPPPPTTTQTTVPPTTSTTAAPPPPTTTVPPSSTTTLPPQSNDGERWIVRLRGVVEDGPNNFWWDAPYLRQLGFGLDTGWTDGDRAAYRCLYGFLTLDGQPVGRVTFTRVEEASTYASINDENMKEGVRYYDGSLAPANASRELGQCPAPDVAYQPYNGPDQRPTVTYETPGGQLLEVRNYKSTVVGNGITFQQVESGPGRVTVVAYEWGNPVIVVYYDSISPQVVMKSDM